MTELRTDWRAVGNTLACTLIGLTVQQSEFVSSDQDVKGRFVREFLALCRFGLGVLGFGSPIADRVLAGIDEELDHYDPQFIDVLCVRLGRYREVLDKEPPTCDLFGCVVDEWARCVNAPTSLLAWASEVFDNTMCDWFASVSDQDCGGPDSASTV